MSLFILVWKSWTKTPFRPLMPQDPDGAFPGWPSLTRSDPALIDSITRPLYYITSPFTNLKQLRARLGLRPCQRGETLTRSSKRVKAEYEKKQKKNNLRETGWTVGSVFEKMERAGGQGRGGGEEGKWKIDTPGEQEDEDWRMMWMGFGGWGGGGVWEIAE